MTQAADSHDDPSFSPALRMDAVCHEFELQWQAGARPDLDEYLHKAPESLRLALLKELLFLDLAWRRRVGEQPAVSDYLARFPAQASYIEAWFREAASKLVETVEAAPFDPSRGSRPRLLHIRCPYCHNSIELSDQTPHAEIACPNCQGSFRLEGDEALVQYSRAGTIRRRQRVGHFELVELIGCGAFGAVWKARDTRLGRWVAVKIPRKEYLDPKERQRFLRDAQLAAQIRHPGIVTVYEVGVEDDLIFIVCDLVEGASLADRLTGPRFSPKEAALLCARVADALQHAHENGVIHRDLKPGNVMLDKQGAPHLIDFGLAEWERPPVAVSLDGRLLGTPAYMSPEQAKGEALGGDRRMDIYSLGVVLFELLTGELPFRGNVRMMLMQVVADEPPAPRTLNSTIPRDIETICLKCLEKSPARRYSTAQEVSEELHRFLRGEPILARPIGRISRSLRWCHRNPVVAGLMTTVAAALIIGISASTYFAYCAEKARQEAWRRAQGEVHAREIAEENMQGARVSALAARQAEDRAVEKRHEAEAARQHEEEQRNRAEQNLYFSRIALAYQKWQVQDVQLAEDLLDLCPRALRNWEWDYLKRLCHLELLTLRGHVGIVKGVWFSPDSSQVVSIGHDRTLRIWDAATGLEQAVHRGMVGHVVVYKWNSERFAAAMSGKITIYDASTGLPVIERAGPATPLGFSSDGRLLAAVEGNSLLVLDFLGRQQARLDGHIQPATSVSFGRDNKLLASAGDYTVRVWDLTNNKDREAIKLVHDAWVRSVVYSPDRTQIASGSSDQTVRLWDSATGQLLRSFRGPSEYLAFSPCGDQIAAGGAKGVRVWNVNTGQELASLPGAAGCIAFSPDGQRLASGSGDESIKLWNAAGSPEAMVLTGHRKTEKAPGACGPGACNPGACPAPRIGLRTVAFRPDGRRVAVAGELGIRVWDTSTGRLAMALDDSVYQQVECLVFSHDGSRLAGVADCTIPVWDATCGKLLCRLRPRDHAGTGPPDCFHHPAFAMDPSGKTLAVADRSDGVVLYEIPGGSKLRTFQGSTEDVLCVAFSSDGQYLAAGTNAGKLVVWKQASGEMVQNQQYHSAPIAATLFSPDGKYLLTAGSDAAVLSRMHAPRPVCQLHRDVLGPVNFTFSPDSTRIASAQGNQVKLWNVTTGQEILRLRGHSCEISALSFSPDSNRIISGSFECSGCRALVDSGASYDDPESVSGEINFWDTATGHEVFNLRSATQGLALSSDGRLLASDGSDGRVRMWTAQSLSRRGISSQEIYLGHQDVVNSAAFTLDGRQVLTASDDGTLCVTSTDGPLGCQVLTRNTKAMTGVAISRNGRWVAAGSRDNTVRLWSWDGSQLGDPQVFAAHQEAVVSVALNKDASRLVSADEKGTVIGWDVAGRRPKWTAKSLGTPRCQGVSMSGDGNWIVAPGLENEVVLLSNDGEIVRRFEATLPRTGPTPAPPPPMAPAPPVQKVSTPSSPIAPAAPRPAAPRKPASFQPPRVLALSFDGKLLAASYPLGYIVTWNRASGVQGVVLKTPNERSIRGITFSPDGRILVTSGEDGAVRIWDPNTGRQWAVLRRHNGHVNHTAFSPDGRLLVSVGEDRSVRTWKLDELTEEEKLLAATSRREKFAERRSDIEDVQVLYGHRDAINSVAFTPDGRRLLTASDDGSVCVWTRAPVSTYHAHDCGGMVIAATLRPDGKQIAAACWDRSVTLIDCESGQKQKLLGHEAPVWSVAYSPDGERLASAGQDGMVRLWEVSSGKQQGCHYGRHRPWVQGLTFSRNGKYLAGPGPGTTVVVCDGRTGDVYRTLPPQESPVWAVAFSPDGKRLAATTQDGSVKLWLDGWEEKATELRIMTLRGHTGICYSAAFSPDGQMLASAGIDGLVRLWNLNTGRHASLAGHQGGVSQVAFSPDGSEVASVAWDRTVRIWPIARYLRDLAQPPIKAPERPAPAPKVPILTSPQPTPSPAPAPAPPPAAPKLPQPLPRPVVP